MQEFIVGIIVSIVTGIILVKVYKFFFSKNEEKGSCGCSKCRCDFSPKDKIKT